MKKFKSKMICKLLSSAMLVSLINVPAAFADNSVVMQIGSNGAGVVDRVSGKSIPWSNYAGVGGTLLHGSLENVYNTPFMHMNKKGSVCIDADNDFLNNITDATFEVWVDNNVYEGDRHNRYLFGLFNQTEKKEILSVELCNGSEYDTRGYGFLVDANGETKIKQRGKDHTIFDEWAHVVVTLDTSNDGKTTRYSMYMNGKIAGYNIINNIDNGDGTYTSAFAADDVRLRIGHSCTDQFFDKWSGYIGRMGDLKVYNYVMTDNEISSSYTAGKYAYINDMSNEFSIEAQTIDDQTKRIDKVEASAITSKNGYVANPYAAGGTVKVSFTSPINKNSVSENSINLVDVNGNVVPGSTSVTVSDMGYVAYITYGQLTEGAQYAVKLNGLKNVNNVVLNDVTSQYFTFTGGTLENGIILVRPFKGKTIEYTLNYALSEDDFDAELCLNGTDFDLEDTEYNEATRTIKLTAAKKFVSGKEYTVGYDGVTKTFTAIADGEFVIEVPVAPEEVQPPRPAAPVEPEGSLLMNVSVVGGRIVDTTGNGTVNAVQVPAVGGRLNANYLANANRTPYIEFTQNGAYMLEVDSPAIEGVENMTFDVWVKNDDRNIDTKANQQDRFNNTLFSIADPTATGTEPWYYHLGLNDGSTYDGTMKGYGYYGQSRVKLSEAVNSKARYGSDNSSLWDEWTHLVITKEKPANDDTYYYMKYYINGEMAGSQIWAAYKYTDDTTGETLDRMLWNDTVLRIGHIDSTGAYGKWSGFIGRISEFKAFNYVKSAADIKAQYEAQKYNYVEDLSDSFNLELVEASKKDFSDYPRGPWAAGGKIKATFSAAVNPATINEKTITLVDASGNVIPGGVTVELSDQGSVAYITYGEVAVGSEYYLKVNGLQSANGVPLTVTSSESITFIEGGSAEKGILQVKGFKGNTIDITLNYALKADEFDDSKAILSAGGYDFANTTATYDEATRTITLTCVDGFVERGKYLFTYDGMSKNFIAEEFVAPVEPITFGTPVFKDQAGNVITTKTVSGVTSICSDMDVVTDGSKEFVAILSVYCGGKLVATDMIGTNNSGCVNKFTNEVTELDSGLTYTFDLEVNSLEEGEEYTSKLMLWESMNNMTPYTMYTPSGN